MLSRVDKRLRRVRIGLQVETQEGHGMNIHEEFVREIDKEIEQLMLVRAYHVSKIPTISQSSSLARQPEIARQLPHKLSVAVSPSRGTNDRDPQDMGSSGLQRHQMAERILRENGTPMTTGAILARARQLGWAGDGDDRKLTNALFTAMTRHETFYRAGPGLFALSEWKQAEEKAD